MTMSRPYEIATEITEEEWEEILARDLPFSEIKARYGQEVAVYAGIARDPDNPEWTKDDFAEARPAVEVEPDWVERWRRSRGRQKRAAN